MSLLWAKNPDPVMIDDRLVIECIDSGRWHVSQEDVLDSKTNKVYQFPDNADLDTLVIDNVTGLTDSGPLQILYLIALALKPLHGISDTILLNPSNGIKIFTLRNDYIETGDFVWQFPDGGIEHTFYTGFFHVPGASKYIVNTDGTIKKTNNDPVTIGTGRDGMIIVETDHGDDYEILAARLVLMAHGKYDANNVDGTVYYVDDDEANIKLDNLSSVPVVDTDAVILFDEDDADHIDRVINSY